MKRIAHVASTIVPFMAMVYLFAALLVLVNHAAAVPDAFATIFNMALNPWAVGGAAVGEAIRWGVARGLFSNEAGLGSSPMAHAAARTNEPVREGLVAMMEPFIDTLVICTLTGLVIVVTGAWQDKQRVADRRRTDRACLQRRTRRGRRLGGRRRPDACSPIPPSSPGPITATARPISCSANAPYCPTGCIYTLLVVIGAAVPLQLVWNIADVTNILMALPNLIGLVLLAGLVKKLKDDYFATPQIKGTET